RSEDEDIPNDCTTFHHAPRGKPFCIRARVCHSPPHPVPPQPALTTLISPMIARILRQMAILLGLALIPAIVSAAVQLQWNHEEPLAAGGGGMGTGGGG